jgi:SPFH domain/band 7 family protein
VENPIAAIENLTATTLRNIIGSMDLDTTLTSRDEINTQMRSLLDVATDPWGIKVNRVELKNILPPDAIREAMEKQMKAEREKRESITLAEAKKQSAVLTAEGNKQAAILNAEADKQKTILAAEAQKEKEIREAEGKAQAILDVQRAEAEGIRLLREARADEAVLRIRALEAFTKVSNGRSTKIIIPSDLQNMSGLVSALRESSSPFDGKEELPSSVQNTTEGNTAATYRDEIRGEG